MVQELSFVLCCLCEEIMKLRSRACSRQACSFSTMSPASGLSNDSCAFWANDIYGCQSVWVAILQWCLDDWTLLWNILSSHLPDRTQMAAALIGKAMQGTATWKVLRMALIGLIALIALFTLSVLFTGLLFHFLRLTADIVRVPFSFLSWSFCRLDLITWGLKGKTPQALQLLAGTSSTMVWCFVS